MNNTDTALAAMPEDQSAFEAWMNKGMTAEATQEETPGAPAATQDAESADESGTADDKAQESEKAAKPEDANEEKKPKGGFQKRISQLTREKRELEERLAKLEAGTAGSEKPAAPAAESDAGKPRQDQFQTWDEYQEALTDWKVEQKLKSRDEAVQREVQARKQQELLQTWAERETAVAETIPDYEETLAASDVPVSAAVRDMLLESEHGPQLAYWLAKHPEVALEIARLDEKGAARAIGRIEAGILPKPEPEKKQPRTSSAPPPIKPVGQAGGKSFDPTDDDVDFATWEKRMNARERAR